MKILIFNWRDRRNPRAGGGEGIVHRIAEHLASTGHTVDMITSRFHHGKAQERIGAVHIFRAHGEIGSHFSVFVADLEKRRGYDVVWDVINLLPWIRARRDLNGLHLRALMHQFTYEALRYEINPFLASLGRIVERQVTPRVYQGVPLAVLAESTRQECIRVGFDPGDVISIPPGIDFDSYAGNPDPDANPRLLFIGRLSRYKGVQHLIKAMPGILSKAPETSLDIVGRGYFRPVLVRMARQLGVTRNVRFHGYVDEQRKQNLIRRAWMLVLPSVQEGWGIPVMEAAAAGVPSVGTDTTGLRDSIIDGSTGVLVPFGDIESLRDSIVSLIGNPDLRLEMGNKARRRARKYDWSFQLPKYASFLLGN